jgi:hypothetical protein
MTTLPEKRNYEARVRIMRMRNDGVVDGATAERLFEALEDAPISPEASPLDSLFSQKVVAPSMAFCGGIVLTLIARGIVEYSL